VAHEANSTEHAQSEHQAHGVGRYFVVWILLLIFTVTTVVTGRMDLGAANLPLALLIASIKATLVVLFFMHMTEAAGANRLVFVVSIVFVLVMMTGVFGDLLTRNPMSLPSAAPPPEIQGTAAQD
jgi:cytochrome c oxidase subunit IV